MNKILLTLTILLATIHSFAQAERKQDELSTVQNTNTATHRLFSTKNVWTFIKLNTRNGQMWQVQFSIEGDNRLVTNLNSQALISKDKEVDGRFTLYPTHNFYTFILLDQVDGKTWQVQWSTDTSNRGIILIE